MSVATHAERQQQDPLVKIERASARIPRLESIDFLRGAVMILMVLDHTKGTFWEGGFDPLDPDKTAIPFYMTRWITHFCAPVFAFLVGLGAYLAGSRGKGRSELSRFLVTRGLWLVFLEFTLVKFGLQFNFSIRTSVALVFWSLGWSMVVLGVLVYLPTPAIGAIGVLMIVGHNLLDGIQADGLGAFRPFWLILHQTGSIRLAPDVALNIAYPLIPWIGVVAAGYAFGEILRLETQRRRRTMLILGLSLTAAFLTLRYVNRYGDPNPWTSRETPLRTAFAFLSCQKYPPSLDFLLMTLGPAIAILSVLDRGVAPRFIADPVITIGRVPLFYFILQWYVIHGLAILVALARGLSPQWLYVPGVSASPGAQFSLPTVYFLWVVVMSILYFPCRWFAGLKARRKDAWLSYF